jgi:hypothetical protein
MLKKVGVFAALSAATAAALFFMLPSQQAPALSGGAPRTWVSGVGDDANPCSRTAPCKTFAGAISKTASYGTINCLDPGGFGAVTITKSITIDCHEIYASSLVPATTAIIINFDAFAPDDQERTVRLRNLNIIGDHTGVDGIKILGAATGSEVMVEDSMIDGFYGANPSHGILDLRSAGGELDVQNTMVRNIGSNGVNPGVGIQIAPSSVTGNIKASLDHVHIENADFGLRARSGVRADVSESYFTGGSGVGVQAENDANMNLDHVVASHNGTGLKTISPAVMRIADTDVTFNGTGITGTVLSFGTNRIWGNTSAGTAPTAAGPASSATGQQ